MYNLNFYKQMKRLIYFFAVIMTAVMFQSCSYNSLVSHQETVDAKWSEVENQYQRRADLIPNVVATVKGYAKHEEATLTAVIEARSKATSITIDPSNMDEAQLASFQKAQSELGQSLGRLMAVAEAYPDLKANENFLELQAQIEGTENRIAVARKNFNDAARSYNTLCKSFPVVIYAGWFGFRPKPYFTADEDAKHAPKVEF